MKKATAAPARIAKGSAVTVTTPAHTSARVWRATTAEEVTAWRNSEASKGMTSGGDTKLPPTTVSIKGGAFTITRSRVKAQDGYYLVSKCVEMKDADGVLWFARRADCVLVAS